MRKYMFALLMTVALLANGFAKEIIIQGTVRDTLLETSPGLEPILNIVPLEACSVSVVNECTNDTHFGKTDEYGRYRLIFDIPDECQAVDTALTISAHDENHEFETRHIALSQLQGEEMEVDIGTLAQEYGKVTEKDGRRHTIRIMERSRIYANQWLTFFYRVENTTGSADLNFDPCVCSLYTFTSDGLILPGGAICDPSIVIDTAGMVINRQQDYFELSFRILTFDPGVDSRQFQEDRKLFIGFESPLTVENGDPFSMNFQFDVFDTSFALAHATPVNKSAHHIQRSAGAKLLYTAQKLHVQIATPGLYSLNLFSVNGQLLQRLSPEKHFGAGEHVFNLSEEHIAGSNIMIARLKGNAETCTRLVSRW